jgi:hypothetical protein
MEIKRILVLLLVLLLALTACSLQKQATTTPSPIQTGGLTVALQCGRNQTCTNTRSTFVPPSPIPAVPVHDPGNWEHIVYLACSDLETYDWTWNGASSGEYASLTPIEGITRATIIYTEFNPLCPTFHPHLMVPVHNKDSAATIGHLSCSDMAGLFWFWNYPGGGWISTTALFGSDRATFDPTELAMNCPSLSPAKTVPVHGATWSKIGFLSCSQLGDYTWVPGAGSGEYVATTDLFGSSQATISYNEYYPACPAFVP